MKRFLKLNEIVEVTGLSRSSIYRLVEIRQFPQQVKLGSLDFPDFRRRFLTSNL